VRRFIFGALTILISTIPTGAQRKVDLKYDRIQFAESFLNAMYPGLGPHHLITLQTGFGWVGSSFFYFGITPCSLADYVPSPPNKYPKDLPKQCPGPMQADASTFFMASIRLDDKKPYLRGYGAEGEFVSGRLEALRQEIIRHPAWAEGEMLNALRLMRPRFGPDDKETFSRTVPVEIIERFSNCRLNVNSAVLIAKRSPPPDNIIDLEWTVRGRAGDKRSSCSAEFEPFEGRLLRLTP
jgi:hypothetical protein